MLDLLMAAATQTFETMLHTWPYLLIGLILAAASRLWLDPRKVRAFLTRHRAGAVGLATGAAVATPLCSCGTMAVVLGMLAGSLPWAPVVAFMVASPLTSPGELILSAGLFGWPFALVFFGASIALGLGAGALAALAEARGWLAGQGRFASGGCGCGSGAGSDPVAPTGWRRFGRELWREGRKLAPLFVAFAFIGYVLNGLIPQELVAGLFGRSATWGVPLAATLGLPLYLNSDASLPLVRTFIAGGASPGAALAFLITGAGTSIGAIAGALTIARWRVIGLVVGTLWVGALATGWLGNVLL